MENSFYKIKANDDKMRICCFCHIKIKNIYIHVLIASMDYMDFIIENDLNEITIYLNSAFVNIEIGNKRYKIEECNIIILEIKINKDVKINYLT